MLKAGADRRILRFLSDDNLNQDCNVQNGVHRMKIMEAAKSMYPVNDHGVRVIKFLKTCVIKGKESIFTFPLPQ